MVPRKYDLGVLFVHGIGEQQQGSTLLQFGEPIIEALRRWYMRQTGQGADCVRVTESVLLPAKNFSPHPAHSVVEFDLKGIKRKWLLAEDWWGDQVVIPDDNEFLSWLMTRGSWVALLHSMERLTDKVSTKGEVKFYKKLATSGWAPAWLRKAASDPKQEPLMNGMFSLYAKPWVLARWMGVALLMQIPLVLAYIVTLLPVPGISKWVTTAIRKVSSVLGDAFVLVKLESQRGAILTHFTESLKYVDQHCNYVAIVAHSQGTAVVCDVLRTTGSSLRPDLLVTFGSGVAKLDQLYLAEASRRLSLTLAGFIPGIWLLLLAVLFALPAMNHIVWFIAMGVLGGLWAGLTSYVLIHTLQSRSDLIQHYRQSGALQMLATEWLDYNALHDPVPSAPLASTFGGGQIQSTMIQNRNSILADHTSYFGNFAEFVFPIAQKLAFYGDTPGPSPNVFVDSNALKIHHNRMVKLLQQTFVLTHVFVPLIAGVFWSRFQDIGHTIWTHLPWGLVPGWMAIFRPGIQALMQRTLDSVPLSPEQWKGVFAGFLLLVLMWIYRKTYGQVWEWWNLQAMESSLQYGKWMGGWRSKWQIIWLSFVAFLPLIAVAIWLWLTR